MALMNTSVFTGYADRIAKHYSMLKTTLASMSASGTPYFTRISATDDAEVEIPMVEKSNTFDVFISASGAATDLSRLITPYTALITGFENHLKKNGLGRTWDEYCADQDVRVSEYTNEVHYAKHRRYMNASNVFSETEFTLGTCAVDPSGIVFTDGDNLGDGTSTNKADGSNFAAARLKAVVTSSNITSPISLQIVGLDETGQNDTINSLNNVAGPSGTEIVLTPASGRFVDVTNVSLVSGGTVGDTFNVVTIKERDIAL